MIVFWMLIVAHLIADFIQPNWLLHLRRIKSWGYELHAGIVTILSAFVLYQFSDKWLLWSFVIGIVHLIIDRGKHKYQVYYQPSLIAFIVDQIFHVIAIFAVIKLGGLTSDKPFYGFGQAFAMTSAGYLTASFAVSILIFEVGRAIEPSNPSNNAVIGWHERFWGITERALGLAFIVSGFYFLFPFPFLLTFLAKVRTNGYKNLFVEKFIGVTAVIIIGIALKITNV